MRHLLLDTTICFAICLATQVVAATEGNGERVLPQVAKIDEEIRRYWSDAGVEPSPAATDGEWCRRLYLDLIGRIPSVEELSAYLQDRSPEKRQTLVTRLLNDDLYTEEYARNWTTIWTNLLIGRTGGTEDQDFANRAGMQKYLRDAFARNKPYDSMVYDLVTATGATKPGEAGFNGATNFLAMKLGENGIQATAQTSKLFLGVQVQCTQCHNHPFNEWKQDQFWQMNAYFRQARALRRFQPGTGDIRFVELTDEDFPGEGNDPSEAEIYYELRNMQLQAAYPGFIDGTPLENRSGYISDVNRRQELAHNMIASPNLDEAIVNRLWAHFLGYGFTRPVDDIGPHNLPSHPDLLKYLGSEFRSSSHDLKQLIRWIVLSQPYAVSSRTTRDNESDDPQLGQPPQFTHFYLRQMRAEELYESLLVATEAHKSRGSYEEQERLKSEWLQQFATAFGTDEGDETTTFNGTIPQALMMFNGPLTKQATDAGQGTMLARLAETNLSTTQKITHLYLAGLSRTPTKRELQIASQLWSAQAATVDNKSRRKGRDEYNEAPPVRKRKEWDNVDPSVTAMQDIWWAILNSNEFILNH